MNLVQSSFHKDFELNGNTFSNVDELLSFSKGFAPETFNFLENWFSDSTTITVLTSGSTGTPKSIPIKKEFMLNSAQATGKYFGLTEKTSALLCLPIHYIAGKMMLIRAFSLGWHLDIIQSSITPLKDVNKEYDFTAMVPMQLENSITKLKLIKQLIVGGGVVSNSLKNKLQFVQTKVFATYGMTETVTHIAAKNLKEQSFYRILPNIKIYKDKRNCLVIDAPNISNQLVITNDVVNLISDKQFEWLGRFDNVINSGGIKLFPEKIEEKLSKIIENRFFVAGISDDFLGEKLVLIVENDESKKNSKVILKSIQSLKIISKYEIPKEIYFLSKFLETETGKIKRKENLELLKLN